MIQRVSLHPFDLGRRLEKIPDGMLDDLELKRVVIDRDEKRWIGFPVQAFHSPKDAAEIRLSDEGFGLLITITEHAEAKLEEHDKIAEVLITRHSHHKRALSGKDPLCSLRRRILDSLKPNEAARPELLSEFPYVLSFFAVSEQTPLELDNTDLARGLCALIEPSRVTSAEADYVEIESPAEAKDVVAKNISMIAMSFLQETLHDCDLHPACHCFASWAGLVLVAPAPLCKRQIRLITALESRVQFAWVMAHSSQLWSRNILKDNPNFRDVDETRWRIMPLLRTVRSLTDASISTRHSNILNALKTTSGLERQIADAEQGFNDTEQYVRYKQRSRDKTYETYVEIALFVLALSQIIPLFFPIPIWSLARPWIILAFLPCLILVVFRLRQ